jgi:hypothetical protein
MGQRIDPPVVPIVSSGLALSYSLDVEGDVLVVGAPGLQRSLV